jgi:hypothetical protein
MATATAAVGVIGGAAKFFEGRKMQQKAEAFIDNFEPQVLQNAYDDLQVSTIGADMRREEAARTTATSVDALRAGGTRALVGGLGRVQQNNNLVNQQISANLDEQQKKIDYAAAQQDMMNQGIIEQRQNAELAGYGQMMNVGMGMKYQGIDNLVNTVGGANASGVFSKGASSTGQGATTTSTNNIVDPTTLPMTQGNASVGFGGYIS